MRHTRRDEQFAKEAFARFLATRHTTPPQWQPGPDSQPPDFWLVFEERRLAVEVTQVMESLAVSSLTLTERGANVALRQAVQQLEREAQAAGLLRGLYHIHVCPLPDLSRIFEDLRARLFAYLQDTAALAAAAPQVLWHGQSGREWTVRKVRADASALAASMSLGGPKWEGDVRNELRTLVSASAASKLEKVRAIPEAAILLLVDAYHYADREEWLRATSGLNFSGFHTVARVYLDHDCQILFTAHPAWSASGLTR
jgi:hypothetical protein